MSRPEIHRPGDTGFTEPWQAEALALALALQESGRISPDEWSATLGEEMEIPRASGEMVGLTRRSGINHP